MGLHEAKDVETRFTGYVEGLTSVIGHADRGGPLHDYCLGLGACLSNRQILLVKEARVRFCLWA